MVTKSFHIFLWEAAKKIKKSSTHGQAIKRGRVKAGPLSKKEHF